jgi:hypothetical protein
VTERWKEGGWRTLEEAMAAYRTLLHAMIEGPFPPVTEEALRWLIMGAPWCDDIVSFGYETDGRGNHRFLAIGRTTGVHSVSTHRALHGDFTPPKPAFDPDNPFGGLVS